MPIFGFDALLIYLSVFCVAWFSGVFGMGGGIILLALLTLWVPSNILVPLHGLLVMISIAPRAWFNWQYIQWHYVKKCSFGILLGAIIGASLNVTLSEDIFYVLLGILMLIIVWFPSQKPWNVPLMPASFVHGTIGAMFGTGGLLQAVFSRLGLARHQFISTFATIMFISVIGRVGGYWWHGFNLTAFIGVVILAFIPSLLGGFIGKKCLDKLPENIFQILFKVLITILSLRLLLVGTLGLF